ncbi:MAG: GAF domain-containing protein [Anaerolineales bacterium]|nr:GAF domain-containing protein [Anaerolineales bacterium]
MKFILDFFSPPVFPDDEEKTRSAYYLNAITLSLILILSAFLIARMISGYGILTSPANMVLSGMISALVVVFILEKNKYVKTASYLNIIVIWVASTTLAAIGNGVKDIGATSYIVIISLASLLLGYRAGLWLTGLSIASIFAFAYAESVGFIVYESESAFAIAVQFMVLLAVGAVFIYLTITSLQRAIERAEDKSRDLEKSNKELQNLRDSLETQVKERTDDLHKANSENKRRAAQFQTVAQIAQKIASERDLKTLLPIITEVIGVQFNYHHVAIYLNDDTQEYTVLRAANSKEGKRMMEREHKLAIGQTSLIGQVARTGASQIVTDVKPESADFSETRSEFALPLKIGAKIIGVLDAQSAEVHAFEQIDAEALTALANQITIAIQNAQLFNETQAALAESQLLYGTVVKQTWKTNLQASPQIGYRYTGIESIPLGKEVVTTEIRNAFENGDIAITHPSKRKTENALAVPLKLRETTIGVLNINFPVEVEVGEDEIDVVRAASQRIAIALENASLLEESQRRAQREQTISEMSAKISAGTEIETILKTAINELGSHISGAQIMVELSGEEGME